MVSSTFHQIQNIFLNWNALYAVLFEKQMYNSGNFNGKNRWIIKKVTVLKKLLPHLATRGTYSPGDWRRDEAWREQTLVYPPVMCQQRLIYCTWELNAMLVDDIAKWAIRSSQLINYCVFTGNITHWHWGKSQRYIMYPWYLMSAWYHCTQYIMNCIRYSSWYAVHPKNYAQFVLNCQIYMQHILTNDNWSVILTWWVMSSPDCFIPFVCTFCEYHYPSFSDYLQLWTKLLVKQSNSICHIPCT